MAAGRKALSGGGAAAQTGSASRPGHGILRRGLKLVLSSPSGAGKTTLCRLLLERDSGLVLSISVTTRPPRPGERDGVDYHFVSSPEFARLRTGGALLECAHVFGHDYGTPRAPMDEALAAGRDVVFDIDWQGAQQLEESAREDLVKVFILPPSAEVLAQRLQARAQDAPDVVAARLAAAASEIEHYTEYDYVIINDAAAESLADVQAILRAERLRRRRLAGLSTFVETLHPADVERGEKGGLTRGKGGLTRGKGGVT